MRIPILVDRYHGDQALTIVCKRCHTEAVLDPEDLLNEGLYECPANTELSRTVSTARRCGGSAVMKYEEAERCKSCGKLGFYELVLAGCCSRRCMLQAEYAESLHQNAQSHNA
jgi:hypothetical protein